MSLKNNLHKPYSPLQAFANHKLTPEIMNVKDLKATLDIVNDNLKSHLKLKLPVNHNSGNIWKYYSMTQINCLFYKNKLFNLMTIPLVEKD